MSYYNNANKNNIIIYMTPIMTFCKQAKGELIYLSRILNNSPLMIGAKVGGCNKFKYFIEPYPARLVHKTHIKTNIENTVDIIICNQSSKYLLGTKMTWIADTMGSRFNFENPNAKEHCCCGKSFNI